MIYKIFATDLDDTFLNSESKVIPENIKAVEQAQKKGAEVVFCPQSNRLNARLNRRN